MVTPRFAHRDDGTIGIELGPAWAGLEAALRDSPGTGPPPGDDSDPPSTWWIDRTLARMDRNEGSEIELCHGDLSRLVLSEGQVVARADLGTFDDQAVDALLFRELLEGWRREVHESEWRRAGTYADDDPSCGETHATLRVFSAEVAPELVTRLLGRQPTRWYRIGDPVGRAGARRTVHAWFLASRQQVRSNDLRRHLDWVLDAVDETELRGLQAERGAGMDVFCFWRSASGQGGPELDPGQMSRLARLNLSLVLDIYPPGSPD